jgi:hypothetical protein
MQLVCVDRRYQRMNCFNVRELQGNLKRKFFTDLVNSNDHRDFLNQSILGMRFKTNNNLAVTPDMEAFYNFGTTTTSKTKTFEFVNIYSNVNTSFSFMTTRFSNLFSFSVINQLNIFHNFTLYLKSTINILTSLNIYSLFTTFNIPSILTNFTSFNLTHFTFYVTQPITFIKNSNSLETASESTFYNSENITNVNSSLNSSSSLSEVSNSYRFNRFSNPLISYDYKCGHYLGIWDQLYPSLMTSYIEVARGIRKAP